VNDEPEQSVMDASASVAAPAKATIRAVVRDRFGSREDFTRGERRYGVILDVAGSKRWSVVKRVLDPEATLVLVGTPKGMRLRDR
jgi:hypothetical protein